MIYPQDSALILNIFQVLNRQMLLWKCNFLLIWKIMTTTVQPTQQRTDLRGYTEAMRQTILTPSTLFINNNQFYSNSTLSVTTLRPQPIFSYTEQGFSVCFNSSCTSGRVGAVVEGTYCETVFQVWTCCKCIENIVGKYQLPVKNQRIIYHECQTEERISR